ncbi:hypothetical protein ACHAAC_05345 [Aeromicrobium sp. CF4.19]|uniref:hypothetical protein n=1 Tax=Aeromicrobium sp. CF4.19 TaxID=3373082 RepID=UPI003EE77122
MAHLYLLRPRGPLMWVDVGDGVQDLARRAGADLAGLDWETSTDRVDESTIRLALRHGEPCSTGLVVDGSILRSTSRGAGGPTLATGSDEMADRGGLLGRLLPGRAARRHDEVPRARVPEHAGGTGELLTQPPNPVCVEHWTALGGRPPDPV